ncbi:hypothetical protein EJB05_03975 [Eragrostis curvula]|uniref:Uncharacterized protein n=1 Tax=Eragrostis curvula TaxID=38414 RepID=A0A5J9WAX4_9POAL|nr:hypothetical protein EJB05_03975 [Eragrostis curvula]
MKSDQERNKPEEIGQPCKFVFQSGPFGTLLLLSWKGSSALKSSKVLCPPSALDILLLPTIIGRAEFLPSSMTNDINTRAPRKIANAAARAGPAGLLMIPGRSSPCSVLFLRRLFLLPLFCRLPVNTSAAAAAALLRASSHGGGTNGKCNARGKTVRGKERHCYLILRLPLVSLKYTFLLEDVIQEAEFLWQSKPEAGD